MSIRKLITAAILGTILPSGGCGQPDPFGRFGKVRAGSTGPKNECSILAAVKEALFKEKRNGKISLECIVREYVKYNLRVWTPSCVVHILPAVR